MGEQITSVIPMLAAVQADLGKRIRTVVPATIVSYDPVAGTATVAPAPKERDNAGDYEPEAPVTEAPVAFPSGGGWSISWALLPGDPVLLMVPDRSTEGWRVTGTAYEPQNGLRHALSYAFVYPGAGPAPSPITGLSSTDMIIRGPGGVAFQVSTAGTVTMRDGAVAINSDGTVNIGPDHIRITAAGAVTIGTNASAPFAARVGDPIRRDATMSAWMVAVNNAIIGLGGAAPGTGSATIGTVQSGSAVTRVT